MGRKRVGCSARIFPACSPQNGTISSRGVLSSLNQLKAGDLSEFLRIAMQHRDRWFPDEPTWGPWFRGHRCSKWKLAPTFYRHFPQPWPVKRGQRNLDSEIQQEFVMTAPSLMGVRPRNRWEWYFLMQHSGTPTRLLDWTEGGLIALYFAVRDSDGGEDAAVWLIDPWWLNKCVVGHSEVVPPGADGMSEEDEKRYQPWLPKRFARNATLPKLSAAVYASHIAPRISTQRSCFTIHGSQVDSLDRLADKENSKLVKVVIPAQSVKRIKQELVTCGIDEVTIYPDLDGLGRFLTTVLKIEASEIWITGTQKESK